jgi:3-methyl-2-oxobutanoate hydroxymethyltransferase
MARLTVKDLLDLKGKRQIVLVSAFDYWTAQACETAGIDMLVTWAPSLEHLKVVLNQVRAGAPNIFIGAGIPPNYAYISESNALEAAMIAMDLGADVIYASGMEIGKFQALGKQKIPFVGHVGYLPVLNTWFGGPRAVGKTWPEAIQVYRDVLAYQEAGAIAVEVECVPCKVAAEITKRVNILTFSMGSGPDCDGQFLFGCDILGSHNGHFPRHSKSYANFYKQSLAAFKQYKEEVHNGIFPAREHIIDINAEEFDLFVKQIKKEK